MIRLRDGSSADSWDGESTRPTLGHPWDSVRAVEDLAFAVLWTSGPNPAQDGAFRFLALGREPGGGPWTKFDRFANPFDTPGFDSAGLARASSRMVREYGVTGTDLASAAESALVRVEFEAFLAGRPLLVPDRRIFATWCPALASAGTPILDLSRLAGLFLPGRLAGEGERIVPLLTRARQETASRALHPADLARALAELIERVHSKDEATLAVLAHVLGEAWRRIERAGEDGADELAFSLALLEHPSRWRPSSSELFAASAELVDGRLTDAVRAYGSLEDALDAAEPRWAGTTRDLRKLEPLPVTPEVERPLEEPDLRTIDEIFQAHLPRLFAARTATEGTRIEPSYREGQHGVAACVARSLGRRELCLVHAPTGTGKTLAYLVPAMLWALRNGVRIGVATYTRALQEQAMEREVPLARSALSCANVSGDIRVTTLKGRTNYLCWRALRQHAPLPADPPEDVLAFAAVALFALEDEDGDLDRLPRRSSLASDEHERHGRALARLLAHVHGENACCTLQADRDSCGSSAARTRAERSHVVITNHALALVRRDFLKLLVFDECEHLHDVAQSAFSHSVSVREVHELLQRLWKPGGGRRTPLDRIAQLVSGPSESHATLGACIEWREKAAAALLGLQSAITDYKLWREENIGAREESDAHSLFREYARTGEAEELLRAHGEVCADLTELSAGLAQLSEFLDALPARGVLRIRRGLEVLRTELAELLLHVEEWIPRDEARAPCFRHEIFYDLETTSAGEDVLVARVLLPHELLGKHYYPDLFGAVLISATTWLQGGFETQATFLGVTRAVHPSADEDRFPCRLRTFRAPEVFDYGRVLVGVPRDAPSVRDGKEAHLAFVARFIGFVAERTRGRVLALFTNAEDLARVGRELEPFFAARRIPFWWQRMAGATKEELGAFFRSQVDSVLLGLDTFWYGADFPGSTLEYLLIVRLPYGVPDRYHHAQCAALSPAEQRRAIYMPRALAKFRQGFGRLMRKESDRGCVFVLDARLLDPRHRAFLRELPIGGAASDPEERLARLVGADVESCVREGLAHMELLADLERRGLKRSFAEFRVREDGPAPGLHREDRS